MTLRHTAGLISGALLLLASSAWAGSAHFGISADDGGRIRITTEAGQVAEITAEGKLFVQGKAVDVAPKDRALLAKYVETVKALVPRSEEIGAVGGALAGAIVQRVMTDLLNGEDGERIGTDAKSEVAGVMKRVGVVCDRLETIRGYQDRIAADVPAFRPFALLTSKDVAQCRKGLHDALSGLRAP